MWVQCLSTAKQHMIHSYDSYVLLYSDYQIHIIYSSFINQSFKLSNISVSTNLIFLPSLVKVASAWGKAAWWWWIIFWLLSDISSGWVQVQGLKLGHGPTSHMRPGQTIDCDNNDFKKKTRNNRTVAVVVIIAYDCTTYHHHPWIRALLDCIRVGLCQLLTTVTDCSANLTSS